MNLKKQKWLGVAIYTPHSQCKSYFIIELTKVLDKCRSNFENIVVLGDFNMEPTNQEMTALMSDKDFIDIIKSNTCSRTSTGICIEPKHFRNTGVIETGVSDHHIITTYFV